VKMEVMEVSTIVARLRGLREEFGDYTLACGAAQPVAVILLDVCNALGLTEEERQEVLGQEVTEAVDEWADCRMWELPKEDP
jgi:(p)ppGpp synthase/HD superfamily hydrolase